MKNELFPEATQILDKYHLIENIYDYGKFVFNNDMKKVEKFKDKIIGYCYSGEHNKIEKEFKKYKHIEIPSTICNLSTYLENNKDKVNYTTYEHNGWFVGSGAIESSNKTVVQLRLKQAGMRWSVDGANYIIALRCMVESDNWDKVKVRVAKANLVARQLDYELAEKQEDDCVGGGRIKEAVKLRYNVKSDKSGKKKRVDKKEKKGRRK